MKKTWIVKAVKISVFLTLLVNVLGAAVQQLWNWLMPAIFGLHTITFGQALGLLALSWLLFGRFGRGAGPWGGGGGRWRHRMAERFEQMPPEEREKFRQGLRGRCGGPPSASEQAAPAGPAA